MTACAVGAFLLWHFCLLLWINTVACNAAPPPTAQAWTELPIHEAAIQGVLFAHDGPPRPTFLVLGGSEGGVAGARELATRVADLGYNALTFAYFGLPQTPRSLVKIPLEDFGPPIQWLKKQPFAKNQKIGVIGGSKGAEAALLIGATRDDINLVIAYAPTHVVWECIDELHGTVASSWTLNGKELPFIPYLRRGAASPDSDYGWDNLRDLHVASLAVATPDLLERAAIPVENIHAPLLLFSGGRDLIWPSMSSANTIAARLRQTHSTVPFKNAAYPDAGHKFGPGVTDLGGTEEANVKAQKESLQELKKFLAENFPL